MGGQVGGAIKRVFTLPADANSVADIEKKLAQDLPLLLSQTVRSNIRSGISSALTSLELTLVKDVVAVQDKVISGITSVLSGVSPTVAQVVGDTIKNNLISVNQIAATDINVMIEKLVNAVGVALKL